MAKDSDWTCLIFEIFGEEVVLNFVTLPDCWISLN